MRPIRLKPAPADFDAARIGGRRAVALTGLGLTFWGTPLSPEESGCRYRIRHPVVPSA